MHKLDELIEHLVTVDPDGYEWTQHGELGLSEAKRLVALLRAGNEFSEFLEQLRQSGCIDAGKKTYDEMRELQKTYYAALGEDDEQA